MNKKSKEETRSKAYNLKDFLNDCKRNKTKVLIDRKAIETAAYSPLGLNGKEEILDFISQQKEELFEYVNTKPFRKGFKGKNPLVDSYKLSFEYWTLYMAFLKTEKKWYWYIKSFHSDNDSGAASIGDIIVQKMLGKNNEKNGLPNLWNKEKINRKRKENKN